MTPMRPADVARLLALAAIWGASFIFVRVLAPTIGALPTAAGRVLLGGAALVAYAAAIGAHSNLRRFGRAYIVIGIVNSAIPFLLYALAALHLPASYSVILNAATPLFGALLATVWLDEPITRRKVIAMLSGCLGVALVSRAGAATMDVWFGWSVAACLGAAFCYAAAGIYLKRRAADAAPLAVAGWSQLAAAAVLLPPTLVTAEPAHWQAITDPVLAANLLALALVCSGLAYLLYYRLLRDVGPTRAFTVTFLMPLFGMLWGVLFLHEEITPAMLAGCALIVGGTFVVLRPAATPARANAAARGVR